MKCYINRHLKIFSKKRTTRITRFSQADFRLAVGKNFPNKKSRELEEIISLKEVKGSPDREMIKPLTFVNFLFSSTTTFSLKPVVE